MGQLVSITPEPKIFSLAEAQTELAHVMRVTDDYVQQWKPLDDRLKRMLSNDPRRPDVERDYEIVVVAWKTKLETLGVIARDLWLVEFDTGEGYLVWKYPDIRLSSYREYGQRVVDRQTLSDYIEDNDPDWARY